MRTKAAEGDRRGREGAPGLSGLSLPSSTRAPVASLMAQLVKNPPAMHETLVQFLGQEDPLEKGLATHCSILAWRIPRTV